MLVVNAYALAAVDLLHLTQQVELCRLAARDAQDLLGILGAFGQLVAGPHLGALLDAQAGVGRQLVRIPSSAFPRGAR